MGSKIEKLEPLPDLMKELLGEKEPPSAEMARVVSIRTHVDEVKESPAKRWREKFLRLLSEQLDLVCLKTSYFGLLNYPSLSSPLAV